MALLFPDRAMTSAWQDRCLYDVLPLGYAFRSAYFSGLSG